MMKIVKVVCFALVLVMIIPLISMADHCGRGASCGARGRARDTTGRALAAPFRLLANRRGR